MSHEIRTPITAILGYTQILATELTGEHTEFVDYIEQNGKRLLDTLSGILDLSKLEAEEYHLKLERLDLVEEAKAAAGLLMPLAIQKGLGLRTEAAAPSLPAELDKAAVNRIITNLVGNAIKFTSRGEVVVSVSSDGRNARLDVRDTGIGMDESFLPHLFDAFKQESNGLARAYEGSGLGLSITKKLVEQLDGSITVRSTKGEGTTFSVLLPLRSSLIRVLPSGDGQGPMHSGDGHSALPTVTVRAEGTSGRR
jgi:signal transduction histidine kinase